jgi:hypothetical protein
VYLKYNDIDYKVPLARSEDGKEVIALYSGGAVSYCAPTEGYTLIHNSFEDIQELTQDEFNLLISTASVFDEYKQEFTATETIINYPLEYEHTCLQFDHKITDDAFEQLLNDITLFPVKDFRYGKRHKFTAYLRKGSEASYSAKVYFSSRKILLFTSSLAGFPSWADNKGNGDKSWVLTPTRIIYYKNGRDWVKTIAEIQMICDSIGIELNQKPITQQPLNKDRLHFPYDIFPDFMQEFIRCHTIQHEYLAAFTFTSLATAIGNTCYLEPLDGYKVKPIIYLAVVAPAGSAKSPSLKIAYDVINQIDHEQYKQYKIMRAAYNEAIEIVSKQKNAEKPAKPILQQMIVQDATIETVMNVLQYNRMGFL